MVELDMLPVVLVLEGVLVLLILLLFLFKKGDGKSEYAVSVKVIDKFQNAEKTKIKELNDLLSTHCDIDEKALENLLGEIKANERNLYKQIIKIYLNKDAATMGKIDKHIGSLSEPYCKALQYSSANEEERKKQEQALRQLLEKNESLAEQLAVAMDAIDEISEEYTRVFSGTQTELELVNSSKKMFGIFHRAGQKVTDTIKEEGSA